jgi:beta-ketodecanoyl-[acyl-carrier-protein] synthase
VTTAAISGTGFFCPTNVIENDELLAAYNIYVRRHNAEHAAEIAAGTRAALRESSDEFVVGASGITRRFVVAKAGMTDPDILCPRMPQRDDETLSLSAEMGVAAARQALAMAGRSPGDVDGVIVAASIMERPYPQIAIEIQNALGIEGFGYDMLAACSSMIFAVQSAAAMVAQGQARAILCITPEILTAHVNLRDREQNFIFGDAAVACLVERADAAHREAGWQIVSGRMKSQFSNAIRNNFGPMNRFDPDTAQAPDKLIVQHGRRVFKEVVPLAAAFIAQHLKEADVAPSGVKRFWLHQANSKMNALIARRVLGREATSDEAPSVLGKYANTAAAGAVIAFHEHADDFAPGDLGMLCTFGAGYTLGSLLLRKL